MSTTTRSRHGNRIDSSVEAWRDAGLIDAAQAEAIRHFEADRAADPPTAAPATHRVPLVAEALGYLGGMLGIIGVVVLGARYWSDMSVTVRLTVALAAVVVFVVAGAIVPRGDDPALERMRSFLWTAGTAASLLAGSVVTSDLLHVNGPDDPSALVLGAVLPATLLSLLLWWRRDRPVQEGLFFVGLLVATGTFVAQFATAEVAGLLVWCVAAIILWSGIGHLTPSPAVAVGAGSLGIAIGSMLTTDAGTGPGVLFALASATGLLVLAGLDRPVSERADRVVLTVVGMFFVLQSLPRAIMWFGPGAGLATGAAVWCTGALLVAVAGERWVRTPVVTTMAGGALLVLGTAVTGFQSVAIATVLGLMVAGALIAAGTVPGHAVLSIFGCLGLLINVPWAISHFFPGEGRAPLLIAVSGLLLVVIAVWLSHQSGELRHQFRHHRTPTTR